MTLSRSSIATLSIILAVILFFALNIFASSAFRTWRLDLTQGSLYSISDGTVRTLKSIQEPVTLKFYFSETTAAPYASVRAYGQRVRDILQQYAAMAGGKIRLEVIDPIPFSEAEEQAAAAGLQGAPIPSGERIYFGLTGSNTIDGRETIPVFLPDREKFLEYDLTALVYNLIREKKPLIGIVSNLPLDTGSGGLEAAMQGRSKPYFIYEQLRQFYETKFLEQDFDRVPADIDVLMIVHPKKLGDRALYAIDQFVMRGGRVLAFLDPNSILSQTQGPQGQPLAGSELSSAASLGPVLQSWGVEIDPKFVVADQSLAQKVNLGGGNVADYLVWLGITPANMDVKDRVTANLRPLNLGTAGIISALEKRTTTIVPLVRTTENSMQVDVKEVEG
ncbi:MAG TPA: ABC transporter, partial [Alphaproteobacteria bacterium]|nr:ABC transporter [Alphaproteobacteria bacterium]